MKERLCNQGDAAHPEHTQGKRRTLIVVILTALTMVMEISFGFLTGSLALLTDGIHMGTHTFALMVTLIAYMVADKHRRNANFAFSSGKIAVLGGYTNAIILGMTALLMLKEAVERLINPREIDFTEAIVVAVLGLLVNLVSAGILSGSHHHHHHPGAEDHNLKAAYAHVLTDAFTSILAIISLVTGKLFGLTWPDALVALLGAAVILRWAYSLLKSSGKILVDYYPAGEEADLVAETVARHGGTLIDLHLWKTSESQKAALLTVRHKDPGIAGVLKEELAKSLGIDHITLEVCG